MENELQNAIRPKSCISIIMIFPQETSNHIRKQFNNTQLMNGNNGSVKDLFLIQLIRLDTKKRQPEMRLPYIISGYFRNLRSRTIAGSIDLFFRTLMKEITLMTSSAIIAIPPAIGTITVQTRRAVITPTKASVTMSLIA